MSKVKEKLKSAKKHVCDHVGELIVETIVCGGMLTAGYYIGRYRMKGQDGELLGIMMAYGDKYPEMFGKYCQKVFSTISPEGVKSFYELADKIAELHAKE